MTNRKIEISAITMTSAYAIARFSMLGNHISDLCVPLGMESEWLHLSRITPTVLNNEDNYKSLK